MGSAQFFRIRLATVERFVFNFIIFGDILFLKQAYPGVTTPRLRCGPNQEDAQINNWSVCGGVKARLVARPEILTLFVSKRVRGVSVIQAGAILFEHLTQFL